MSKWLFRKVQKKIFHQVRAYWKKLTCELLILARVVKLSEQNGSLLILQTVFFFPLKIQASVVKWSKAGYLRMIGRISNGLSIIYHVYEACSDCVCIKKAWGKSFFSSRLMQLQLRFSQLDSMRFELQRQISGLCLNPLSQETKARCEILPFFSTSESLDDEAAVVSEGFRDDILNQLNNKTSFDYENNRAPEGATQIRTD